MGRQAMHNDTGFLTQPDVRTGLLWKIPLKRAFRYHKSPFCIRGADMGFPTNILILSYLLQNSDGKRTIWKGLKVQKRYKQEKKEENIGQEN